MISAVVVSHDSRATLGRCLASLPPDVETVVVDTASQDDGPELVARGWPSARLIRLAENVGFGAAVNRGVEVARGDRLLLLNPDAWLTENALARMGGRLESGPGLAAVAPRLVYPDGRPQWSWSPDRGLPGELLQKAVNPLERSPRLHRVAEAVARLVAGPGWYTAACLLVRREALAAVGGFDEGYRLYFEDADLALRLRAAGWGMARAERAVAVHRKGGSAPTGATALEYRRSQLRYYRRHRPAWEVRVLLALLRRRYPEGPIADWLAREAGAG